MASAALLSCLGIPGWGPLHLLLPERSSPRQVLQRLGQAWDALTAAATADIAADTAAETAEADGALALPAASLLASLLRSQPDLEPLRLPLSLALPLSLPLAPDPPGWRLFRDQQLFRHQQLSRYHLLCRHHLVFHHRLVCPPAGAGLRLRSWRALPGQLSWQACGAELLIDRTLLRQARGPSNRDWMTHITP